MIAGISTSSLPASIDQLLGARLSASLDRLDLLSRKILSGKLPGERRSKRRGRSVEFDDFRAYTPGDDLRHVDWNILARLDRLFIKLFREEEDLSLNIVVDATASMNAGSPPKGIFAHQLAMALAYIGLVNQNRVSVATFGMPRVGEPDLRQLSASRGRGSLQRVGTTLLESLAASTRPAYGTFNPSDQFAQAMRLASRVGAPRGIVVIISDFLCPDGCEGGLRYLGAASMSGAVDTYALQVLSPGEIEPSTDAAAGLLGDLRLTDVESGVTREVTVSPQAIARYRTNRASYQEKLHSACTTRGIAHFVITTTTPIDSLLLNTLRRGGLLR